MCLLDEVLDAWISILLLVRTNYARNIEHRLHLFLEGSEVVLLLLAVILQSLSKLCELLHVEVDVFHLLTPIFHFVIDHFQLDRHFLAGLSHSDNFSIGHFLLLEHGLLDFLEFAVDLDVDTIKTCF